MKKNYPHILQTPEWGKAKKATGLGWEWFLFAKTTDEIELKKVDEIDDWSKIVFSVLILEKNLGLGQILHYIPRGPFVDWSDTDHVKELMDFIKSFAKERKALFVRMEPHEYGKDFNVELIKNQGFKATKDFVQAYDTVSIPLEMSEDELMASFHSKHRYNIRLAKKRGLTVRSSTDPNDVTTFYKLTTLTNERSGGALNPHPESYYQTVVKELSRKGMVKVYIVEKEGIAASSSIVFTFGDEAIYMYGAANYEFRRDMPNHLREWQTMLDAQEDSRKILDMWGATMRQDAGGGIKRYKLGYHDEIIDMAGTFDWSTNWPLYYVFNALNTFRRTLLKLKV